MISHPLSSERATRALRALTTDLPSADDAGEHNSGGINNDLTDADIRCILEAVDGFLGSCSIMWEGSEFDRGAFFDDLRRGEWLRVGPSAHAAVVLLYEACNGVSFVPELRAAVDDEPFLKRART